jgi:hypothetical protein
MNMKKKLLVLLIAVIPTLMPNLASAVVIDWGNPEGWECGLLRC